MVMTAYNKVNGIPCVEHSALLRIVKDEWGFDGVMVSDWFATKSTAATANAGVDLEMPGPARFLGSKLVDDASPSGEVSEERLTDMAARFIRLADRAGVLGSSDPTGASQCRPIAAETLRRAAAAGFVLLKNDGDILPLTIGHSDRVAVIGPNAAAPCYQGGTFAKVNLAPDVLPRWRRLIRHFGDAQVTLQSRAPRSTVHPVLRQERRHPGRSARVSRSSTSPAADPARPAYLEVRPASTFVWFNDIPGSAAPVTAAVSG